MVGRGSALSGDDSEFAELVMQPYTPGKTYEETERNAQEAIESYLEYCQEEGITPPQPRVPQVA